MAQRSQEGKTVRNGNRDGWKHVRKIEIDWRG